MSNIFSSYHNNSDSKRTSSEQYAEECGSSAPSVAQVVREEERARGKVIINLPAWHAPQLGWLNLDVLYSSLLSFSCVKIKIKIA
jgi:hypothetical protein